MEGPARVAHAARKLGLPLEVVPLFEGVAVPSVRPTDLLVVMGGPMGVSDVGHPAYPYLAQEEDLLRARVSRQAPTLGICLGAQLLAHAAGALVYPNVRAQAGGPSQPVLELGWAPVHFHGVRTEPVLRGLQPQETMLHWHGDTFDLPPGAIHLASTPLCQNQAFRLGHALFGLQFHCEVDAESVERWLQEDAAYVERALGSGGADLVRAQTRALTAEAWAAADRLLDNVFQCMALALSSGASSP